MKHSLFTLVILALFSIQTQAQLQKEVVKETTSQLQNTENTQRLDFYPAVFSDRLNITSDKAIDLVQVHDFQGNLVYETRYTKNTIDLSRLKRGQYIITVCSYGRIIKEKMLRL